jgi:hypothetical protein
LFADEFERFLLPTFFSEVSLVRVVVEAERFLSVFSFPEIPAAFFDVEAGSLLSVRTCFEGPVEWVDADDESIPSPGLLYQFLWFFFTNSIAFDWAEEHFNYSDNSFVFHLFFLNETGNFPCT